MIQDKISISINSFIRIYIYIETTSSMYVSRIEIYVEMPLNVIEISISCTVPIDGT